MFIPVLQSPKDTMTPLRAQSVLLGIYFLPLSLSPFFLLLHSLLSWCLAVVSWLQKCLSMSLHRQQVSAASHWVVCPSLHRPLWLEGVVN